MTSLDPRPEHAQARTADDERGYLDDLSGRIRVGSTGALLRTGGIQALWIVVIVAGAGVSLSEAVGASDWVPPTLGFVVVVAAGLERVFARATPAAAAQDALRRALARERRAFRARVGAYAGADAFDQLVDRCERFIALYDQTMIQYAESLAKRAE